MFICSPIPLAARYGRASRGASPESANRRWDLPGFCIKSAAGSIPGETVLIQGATGVAGRLAVKVARLLGAGRIVATGRDDNALQDLLALGADAVITTAVPDDALARAFTQAAGDGYDVVLDFLWGHPTEILLRTLVPDELETAKPTRLVVLP
jgi:NADPH:quinone reductase-like Zn-dependent oxidoreductase